MRPILLAFYLLPILACSQDKSISLMMGGEYKEFNTHAWTIEFKHNRDFQNLKRWSSEFGLNYSVLEFSGDNEQLDTSIYSGGPAGVTIFPSGHIQRERIHYYRKSYLRFQAGVNSNILKSERFKLSAGVNFVNEIRLNEREHGQSAYVPAYNDTAGVFLYHFDREKGLFDNGSEVSLQLQPHIDLIFAVTDRISLTSRFAYYGQVLPSLSYSRLQGAVGVSYSWE